MVNPEINQLKIENEMLKQKIKTLEHKKYQKVDLNLSSHVQVIKLDDDIYRVVSQITSKDFKLDHRSGMDELKLIARDAEYQVKNAYIKSSFEWIIESTRPSHEFENLKIYIDKNIPTDSIFINPKLLTGTINAVYNIGYNSRAKLQDVVRFIVDQAIER
jgi:hypothetical protein